jgi:hypothetical protein
MIQDCLTTKGPNDFAYKTKNNRTTALRQVPKSLFFLATAGSKLMVDRPLPLTLFLSCGGSMR